MRVHNRYPDPSVAILFMALLFYRQQELAKTLLWDLNQNQNAVFSFNTFPSGSMPPLRWKQSLRHEDRFSLLHHGNPHNPSAAEDGPCAFAAFLLGWFPQAWEHCNRRHCSSHQAEPNKTRGNWAFFSLFPWSLEFSTHFKAGNVLFHVFQVL